jgi:hypothetical protein
MNRVTIRSRVDSEGVVHVDVPVGLAEADREVLVTIEAIAHSPMSPEEWRTFIDSTAGSIADPTFVRPPQGDYEEREELS